MRYIIHRLVLIYCVAILLPGLAGAQGGNWVWVSGSNTSNQGPVYGAQGVAAPGNTPPGVYEAATWADKQGNFWVYGGVLSSGEPDDLWKYDPVAHMWTWVKGSGTGSGTGTFGTKGVPSPGNNPPGLGWGVSTWTDEAGDLWLWGGASSAMGSYADLWRYNIASNQWTWMNGTGLPGSGTVYGTQGVANPANIPGAKSECTSTWVDGAGNLWMFGGYDASSYNDMWQFNIQSGMWIWEKGSAIPNDGGNYGTRGVTNATNLPPARGSYTNWKDAAGNFYIFGGTSNFNSALSDVWKYDPVANLWTWIAGENTTNSQGTPAGYCVSSGYTGPSARFENRTPQMANCHGSTFYSFGGVSGTESSTNDLWVFDAVNYNWTLVKGINTIQSPGSYGTQGVVSSTNLPPARCGQSMCVDNAGNLWMFGGSDFANYYSDVWQFLPNPNCISVTTLGGGLSALAGNNPICIGDSTILTITGDSLQISPANGTHFTDSGHVSVNPDTTTTYIITGHSRCRYNDTTRITVSVIKPGALVYQLSDTNVCGTNPVTLHLTGQANSQITPFTGITVLDSLTYLLAPATTTTYRVTGTSTLCGGPDTGIFTIHVTPVDPVTITGSETACGRDSIVITITGLTNLQCHRTSPYYFNYLIDSNRIVCYPYNSNTTFPAIISGYNSCGELIFDTLVLSTITAGALFYSASKTVICLGDSSFLTVNAPGVISVNPSASVNWVGNNIAWLKPDSTTTYTISSSATCVTDSGYQLITVSPQAHAAFTLTGQPTGPQTIITVNNQSTGYTALSWYHDSTLLQLTDNTISTTDTGNYCITLVAVNTEGCDDSVTHCIEISGQSFLQVPQAFTPNGDGVNDYFTVYGKNLSSYQIRIYNRWGEEVYSSSDLSELNNLSRGWNGTYKGKLQGPASFTWVIKAVDEAGNTINKNGYVILIR